jgi:asparagine synthase (glutamine-hydrolysing)
LAYQYLPHDIIERKKQGFGIPVGQWFRTKLKDRLIETVLKNKQRQVEMNYDYIEKLVSEHLAGKDHSHKMWILYVYHKWIELNFER